MPTEPTTPDEVSIETPLPGLELPDYHGRKPAGMKTSISGTGNRIQTPHEIGTTVVLLLEAKVKVSGFEEGENGLLYVEKLSTKDLFEIQGAQGRRLVSAVRSAYRTATDGEIPLPVDGDTYPTDSSGVVVTPGDTATIADDPLVDALTNDEKTPAVVVYSDGVRDLWPDEYDPGDPRPTVGTVVLDDEDRPSVVKSLLDATTGETIAEISDAGVDEALLAYEKKIAAAEDAEDRNAAFDADVAAHAALVGDRDETPVDQVDPPEANEDLSGDPADVFPGIAGDAPDDEIEIDVDDDDGPAYTDEDLLLVDQGVGDVKALADSIDDRAQILRLLAAEEAGRGRGLTVRKGVVEALTKRAAALFSDPTGIDAPGLPDSDLDVPDDVDPSGYDDHDPEA